jgi:hypothetical protein
MVLAMHGTKPVWYQAEFRQAQFGRETEWVDATTGNAFDLSRVIDFREMDVMG